MSYQPASSLRIRTNYNNLNAALFRKLTSDRRKFRRKETLKTTFESALVPHQTHTHRPRERERDREKHNNFAMKTITKLLLWDICQTKASLRHLEPSPTFEEHTKCERPQTATQTTTPQPQQKAT